MSQRVSAVTPCSLSCWSHGCCCTDVRTSVRLTVTLLMFKKGKITLGSWWASNINATSVSYDTSVCKTRNIVTASNCVPGGNQGVEGTLGGGGWFMCVLWNIILRAPLAAAPLWCGPRSVWPASPVVRWRLLLSGFHCQLIIFTLTPGQKSKLNLVEGGFLQQSSSHKNSRQQLSWRFHLLSLIHQLDHFLSNSNQCWLGKPTP